MRLLDRVWGRVCLSPTSHELACTKVEINVQHAAGVSQLWGRGSGPDVDVSESSPGLVVLRLLGGRGRAELATEDPADRLPSVRSITWTLNPPGFGKSTGPVSIDSYICSALAAYDHLAQRYPNAKLWVYGKSIGATVAIYLASHRTPSSVVAKNVVSVPAVAMRRLQRWAVRSWAARVAAGTPAMLDPILFAEAARAPRAICHFTPGSTCVP